MSSCTLQSLNFMSQNVFSYGKTTPRNKITCFTLRISTQLKGLLLKWESDLQYVDIKFIGVANH